MNLLLIQDVSNMMLVAFYYDVYGNFISSSRKVTINEQNNNIILDHLSVEPVMLVEEEDLS